MTDITYYNNSTGQIIGHFKNIDLTNYPGEIPQYYIEGIYDGNDYYMVGSTPTTRTTITLPANRFLKSGTVDSFTISVPNPSDILLCSTVSNDLLSVSDAYSTTVTDGSFVVSSSIAGYYRCSVVPSNIAYKPLQFEFQVTDNQGVMTSNYSWSFNDITFRAAKTFNIDTSGYVFNFQTAQVNARRQVPITSSSNYSMSFPSAVVNASRDITIDTSDYSMSFETVLINAGHIISNEVISGEMTFHLPVITIYEPIDLTINLSDSYVYSMNFETAIVNAERDEVISTPLAFSMSINSPTITVI